MKSKPTSSLLVLLLALASFFVYRWDSLRKSGPEEQLRSQRFDRRTRTLIYTRHALCRMDCRQITKTDIQEIMQAGEINYAKSNSGDKPCPTYALQGRTSDGQNIRVIFAQCDQETKVVTCYEVDREVECYCPGDEKKKGSR
ncbi:DUF4258 domain-containing protein [Paraflavisolibacter sp. H34]|uniref:DUF4258 domain-containing protein n=1 Tax=Huijunlia imazamoxiresistens TaxID=3127457 RepID=UPI003017BA2B